MKIVYLKPLGGYATELRSDTLWGTLCWGVKHLWGNGALTQFTEAAAAGQPEFVVSSAFPYKQYGTERIPFFPNPLLLPPTQSKQDATAALENARLLKRFKAIEYVEGTDFVSILRGELRAEGLMERLRQQYRDRLIAIEEKREYLPSPQDRDRSAPVLEEYSMTHNTINRRRGGTLERLGEDNEPAGQLFHAGECYWSDPYSDGKTPNTGIFFLVEGDASKLEPLLMFLRHWGFGADRSTGKGFFDASIQDFSLPEVELGQANALVNLSLWCPTEAELHAIDGSNGPKQYRVETRCGYVGRHDAYLRKHPVRYFKEGSILPLVSDENQQHRYRGRLVEQTQCSKLLPHKVWDNGLGLVVRMRAPLD